MRIREPIVAGQFYPKGADACRDELGRMFHAAAKASSTIEGAKGGLVPHAGWVYSGPVAASVFQALAQNGSPSVVVLFGGVHRSRGREAALFGSGRWETPLGPVTIDGRLAERVLGHTNIIVDDPYAHEEEHSLEVQLPLVKYLFPDAKILPIMVPPTDRSHEVGRAVGSTLKAYDYNALIVGTTDLTHYGPDYGFVPSGIGEAGIRWAKDQNDARFIDRACAMDSEGLVEEALEHRNACSSGAAAATSAALELLGCSSGVLLQHTSSAEVASAGSKPMPENSVGYAGIVFA